MRLEGAGGCARAHHCCPQCPAQPTPLQVIVSDLSSMPNGIAWNNGSLFIASLDPYKSCRVRAGRGSWVGALWGPGRGCRVGLGVAAGVGVTGGGEAGGYGGSEAWGVRGVELVGAPSLQSRGGVGRWVCKGWLGPASQNHGWLHGTVPGSPPARPAPVLQLYRLDNVDTFALGKKAATLNDLVLIRDDLPIDRWHGWKFIRCVGWWWWWW